MNIVGLLDGRSGARDSVVMQLTNALGGALQLRTDPVPAGTNIVISWRFKFIPNMQDLVRDGVCLVHLDLGYFDDRKFERYSISINGVHGTSAYVRGVHDLPVRPHPIIKPWKQDGDFIMIASPGYKAGKWKSIASVLPLGWPQVQADKAAKAFGKPAKIRHHPRNGPPGCDVPGRLDHAFEESYAVVTFAGMIAIQSILEGIPTVIMHPRCPAYAMGSPHMEAVRPDGREEWAHHLSHREYDMRNDLEYKAAADFVMMGYQQCLDDGELGSEQSVQNIEDFLGAEYAV